MLIQISDILYIDFEASSLSQVSWPIEIGIAWIEGAGVQSWSTLIRPDVSWSLDDWSARSAEVHNISYEEVMNAPRATVVARQVAERLQGKTLVSDNSEFEIRWMNKLLGVINMSSPDFLDYDVIAQSACHGYPDALNSVHEHLGRTRSPHRARMDAERLTYGILRGLQVKRQTQLITSKPI